MKGNVKTVSAKLALFGAALIWGSSFLVVKNSMDYMQPHYLLGFRFTVGCLLLCMIFIKRLGNLNLEYFIRGGIAGLFLFVAYSLQTIGIIDTTPGKNAFLTTIYCVLVPFFYWLIDKKKPSIFNFVAGILTIIGVGLVSLKSDFTIQMGDAFTLASGIFYAAHMVAVSKFSKNRDPVLLTIIQFGFCAIFSWIVAFVFEEVPQVWNTEVVGGLLYLAVFATALALLLQNIGQKYTKPAQASIIMSLEAVFGVIFSVIFYHEEITFNLFMGFLLIFFAVLVSETTGILGNYKGFLSKKNDILEE